MTRAELLTLACAVYFQAGRMDVVWGESAGVKGQLWILYPLLFALQVSLPVCDAAKWCLRLKMEDVLLICSWIMMGWLHISHGQRVENGFCSRAASFLPCVVD
jgi:hypothetical protein